MASSPILAVSAPRAHIALLDQDAAYIDTVGQQPRQDAIVEIRLCGMLLANNLHLT
jgi:hypothetical protein